MTRRARYPAGLGLLLTTLVLASCGGDDKGDDGAKQGSQGGSFEAVIADAQRVDANSFPSAKGKTFQEMVDGVGAVNLGLATSIYTPGRNRLAFGVIDQKKQFVYGPTVVYLTRDPSKGRVIGPIAAPADPLLVKPAFRSQGAAQATDDVAAIYDAEIDLPQTGRWFVLALSRNRGKTYGAASQIDVKKADPTPARGQRAPVPTTDTLANTSGGIKSIDTRVPPDDMHDKNLKDVAGKKPVAVVFATPQLCETRVCGPVVDIAAQMKAKYGNRMDFIHQEVYKDNNIKKGLRPPLEAYRLTTEPWLFTIDRRGRVAARLQGSFGTTGFERAIKAAL